MKYVFIVLMVLMTAFAFGGPQEEVTNEITILMSAPDMPESLYAFGKFARDFPDVKITPIQLDLSDGSTLTMDAQLAAGTPPNVYVDFVGRVSKYFVPEFALDLSKHVSDLDKYTPGILDAYTRDGAVFGLPMPAGVQGFAVNTDLTDSVGFEVKDDWTIVEFLDLAERIKAKYEGKRYVTALFAGNQSGDYLVNNWFAAFGVKYYNSGDYSKTVIRETGGAKVYEFFQHLVRQGYIREGSATFVDDDYVIHWASGEIAGGAFFPSWAPVYFDTLIKQGAIEKPFNYKYVPFPRGPGVDKVPTYSSGAAIVVHKTGTEKDVWAARLAEYLNDAQAQAIISQVGVVPTRTDSKILSTNPYIAQTMKIAQDNGFFDVGITTPYFAATRPQHFPVLQKVLNLAITPEDAIAEYERRLNDALK